MRCAGGRIFQADAAEKYWTLEKRTGQKSVICGEDKIITMDDTELYNISNQMRQHVIQAVYYAKSGHPGGSLSICDILAVLFFKQMNVEPSHANDENRDRFVLSKGHAAPAYYAALAMRGFFDEEELKRLRKIDSFLQGHPCMGKIPGVDMSSGSLGQGLSAANGMALVAKAEKRDYRVYCICGDGELQEGQIWEAAMTAAHYKLDNLTLFVDCNGLQIDGKVEDVMNVAPVLDKWKAFGWNAISVDGHDIPAINEAVDKAKISKGRPTAIVCRTVKGKGVSFMENQAGWHGAAPDDEQFKIAMDDLSRQGGL